MCGIIGVTGVPDAARVAYLGLYSLQHRGQESAGMVVVDGEGVARSHRGMGLVSDIFNERVLSDLPGDVAIGHARYSTAGSSVLANAQPMLARYREGPLALAHNGNLTNAVQLRSDLVAKGSLFRTSSASRAMRWTSCRRCWRGRGAAACSSWSTFRAPTAPYSTGPWTAYAGPWGTSWPASIRPRGRTACFRCPIRPTPWRSVSRRSPGSSWSTR